MSENGSKSGEFVDRMIKCKSCGKEFLFSVAEQEFFEQRDFRDPKHCLACRKRRKAEKQAAGS